MKTILLVLASAGLVATAVQAQDYPNKPVHIVVPSTPGGGTDTVTRLLLPHLTRSLGQPFLIDYKPGAGIVIGAEAVARAAPDGYTLLMAPSTLAINHVTRKTLPYDAVRDFAPITQLVTFANVLVVHPALPAKSLGEFIALAKRQPGELTYGSAGVGTAPHLAMELLKSVASIDVRHIPYKGVAPALTDIIAGRVSGMMVNVLSARPQLEAGKLRALAVSGPKRLPDMPDVQTVAEAGLEKAESFQWFGLLAPAGTPEPILARVQSESARGLKSPEMLARLALESAEPVGSTPSEFASLIRQEKDKWTAVARAANIQPE